MPAPEPSDGSPGDDPASEQTPPHSPPLRTFTTEELFGPLREIWIQHGDMQYRLRITSTDKLVLTK